MDNPYYSIEELNALGLRVVDGARNVTISRLCRFYGVKGTCGDHVRIDDFCILRGSILIGSHVHISAFCVLGGAGGKILIEDFAGLACGCSLYTKSDDYNANVLSNPTVPDAFKKIHCGDVTLMRGALVGAHCVLLPGALLGRFATCAAMKVINYSVPDGQIIGPQGVKSGTRDVQALHAMADKVIAGSR